MPVVWHISGGPSIDISPTKRSITFDTCWISCWIFSWGGLLEHLQNDVLTFMMQPSLWCIGRFEWWSKAQDLRWLQLSSSGASFVVAKDCSSSFLRRSWHLVLQALRPWCLRHRLRLVSPRLSRLCKPEAGLAKKPKAGLRPLGLVLLATRFLSTCPCHRHDVWRVTSFFQEPGLILRTSCTQGLPANFTSP